MCERRLDFQIYVSFELVLAMTSLIVLITYRGAMDFNPNVVISLSPRKDAAGVPICNTPLAKNVFFVSGGAFTSGAACTINGNVLSNGAITAGASGIITGKSSRLPHLIPALRSNLSSFN